MAITPRDDSRPVLTRLASSLLAAGLCAVMPVSAETVAVQPTLSITSSSVKQTNVLGTPSWQGSSHELVTVVSPGLLVAAHGANLLVDGAIHLDAYHYGHGTQDDQVVPSGSLLAQLLSRDAGVGLEAGWTSKQVPAQFISSGGSSAGPNNEYTTTEWRLAPYLDKQIGSSTHLKAKLDRTLVQSTQQSTALTPRPNTTVTTGSGSLAQQAQPLGYELSFQHQNTKLAGQSEPVLKQSTGLAKGIYALFSELELGILVGREATDVLVERYRDRVHGWSFNWRPQERTSLTAQVEHRFFGQAWQVDASHRMTWLALSASFSRHPTTYAASAGTLSASSLNQTLTATIPDPVDRAKAINDFLTKLGPTSLLSNAREIYNLTAQLRQEASGRVALIGRRDVYTFAAGRVDSTPLTQTQSLLSTASTTRDYFFSGDWVHQLAPTWRVANGLKWTRSHQTPVGQPYAFGREFSWRGALITDMSPTAAATLGLRRRIVHTTNYGDSAESAVFAGLDYKF